MWPSQNESKTFSMLPQQKYILTNWRVFIGEKSNTLKNSVGRRQTKGAQSSECQDIQTNMVELHQNTVENVSAFENHQIKIITKLKNAKKKNRNITKQAVLLGRKVLLFWAKVFPSLNWVMATRSPFSGKSWNNLQLKSILVFHL